MIEALLAVLVGGALYWLFILRPGRIDFWKVAAKYPDAAYEHFKADATWVVFDESMPADYRKRFPRSEWVGPFRLAVPKLGGRTIRVLGRDSCLEKSQNDFLRQFAQDT